jgi:hypothetical protein
MPGIKLQGGLYVASDLKVARFKDPNGSIDIINR